MASTLWSTPGEPSARHYMANADAPSVVSGPWLQSSTSHENEMVQNFVHSEAISFDVGNLPASTLGPLVGGYDTNPCQPGVLSVPSLGMSSMQQVVDIRRFPETIYKLGKG